MTWSYVAQIIISLLTLTLLEVVLGIDNLVFIAVASSRLPKEKQKIARRLGLAFALITRLILLASVVIIIKLTKPLFSLYGHPFSVRDILLILGGLFLLYKGTQEIHAEMETSYKEGPRHLYSSVIAVATQIGILDIIFSLDSVFTAIGMTTVYWVMATAICFAILAMIFLSEPLSRIIQQRPSIKMLALSFLLLIGTVLIADGFSFHIPREYIYVAICYSIFVEVINSMTSKKRRERKNSRKKLRRLG